LLTQSFPAQVQAQAQAQAAMPAIMLSVEVGVESPDRRQGNLFDFSQILDA
jgi:hypothetical protein